jgi:Fe-S cluster biogenesis protein NfuA/bacterioferritin-associated ferredoxin
MSDAFVCHCLKLSKDDLYQAYKELPEKSLEALMTATKAGSRCGKCVDLHSQRKVHVQDLLQDWNHGNPSPPLDQDHHGPLTQPNDFSTYSFIKKIEIIEQCLDKVVRPELIKDQGTVEFFHLEHHLKHHIVYLDYQGQCRGCQSSWTHTADWIEEKLQQWCGFSSLKVGMVQENPSHLS